MGTMDWEHTRKSAHAADVALEEPIEGTTERIAGVYRERAKKLSQTAASAPSGTPVLVFRLEQAHYGIELASVSAVLGAVRMTPVPEAEEKLEGLVNVKGTIRPVLNLRFLLNLPPAGRDAPEYFLLLRREQHELGIKVEEIERISALAPAAIAADSPVIASQEGAAKYVSSSTFSALTMLRTSALFAEFWNERSEA